MKQRDQRWEDQSFPKAHRSRQPGDNTKTLKDLTPQTSLLGKQDTRTRQNTDFSSFLHMYKASALLGIQESHQDDRNLYFGRKWHIAYKQHED